MTFEPLINWFIHPSYLLSIRNYQKARLIVSGCLLTSLFSTSYVLLSVIFHFPKGIYFTAFNVIGYFALPFLVRTRTPLLLIGNLYTLLGSITVLVLTWFSGGMWSAIYPWIIAIPVLALLIAGRGSAIYWGVFAWVAMMFFGVMELRGFGFPVEYNTAFKSVWYLSILPGLLLIIMVVAMTFESNMQRALKETESQKETIELQSEKLQVLIEEKDSIIGILAHDLRNPLGNIGALLSLASTESDPGERAKLLDHAQRASANAQHLVKDVLEMAALEQLESGNLQAVHAPAIVSEVVQSFESTASDKGIAITVVKDVEVSEVLVDPIYFRQGVENLISNALKFSNADSRVEVTIEDKAGRVLICVRDFGPGVPPDEENKLFQRFSRLSTQPTAGESSSGLGLSLVKRYMELMNGRVWHERPEGGGAMFVMEVPRA